MQPNEELSTMVQRIHLELSKEPPLTGNVSNATGRTTPYSGTARLASPAPPYEQFPTTLQPASPVPVKSRNLEGIITNIKKKKNDDYFEKQFSQNLIPNLKRDIKSQKTETVGYIKDSFGEMLDNMDFVSWIPNKLGYKPNCMKKLLEEKAYDKRRSIFRNVRFCNSIDSSQTKILWRKK